MKIFFSFILCWLFSEAKIFQFNPPYLQGLNDGLQDFEPSGGTSILKQSVQLTPQERNKESFLWAKRKNDLTEWEANFAVKVTGPSKGSDGIGFWFVKEPQKSGKLFSVPANFEGIGVVLDSQAGMQRRGYPVRLLRSGNGATPTITVLGGCNSEFRNVPSLFTVRLIYTNKTLRLYVSNNVRGARTAFNDKVQSIEMYECVITNNAANPIELPTDYYFGFQSSTSQIPDKHELISANITAPVHLVTLADLKEGKFVASHPGPVAYANQDANVNPQTNAGTNTGGAYIQATASNIDRKTGEMKGRVDLLSSTLSTYVDSQKSGGMNANANAPAANAVGASEVNRALLQDVAGDVQKSVAEYVRTLTTSTTTVKESVQKLTTSFEQLEKAYEERTTKLKGARDELNQALRNTEQKNRATREVVLAVLKEKSSGLVGGGGLGFWSVPLGLEIVFAIFVFFYWKRKDDQNKKI